MAADIIVTIVIIGACCFAVWYIKGVTLKPIVGNNTALKICIHAWDEANDLEHTVQSILWLMDNGSLYGDILICNAGMAEEACAKAKTLEKQDNRIYYLEKWENYGAGKRAD